MVMMRRRSLEMGPLSLNQQTNSGIMDDHLHHPLDSNILPYSHDISSSESDLMEGGSSSSGSSSPTSPKVENGCLGDMSSLLQQLPFKRGLSKHFNGKSQSFGSLSNVTCLEDLAKPENPYNKKLKYCKSYMGLSEAAALNGKSASSKLISKKSSSSRGSCSSLGGKRNGSFIGNNNSMRPPTHPPPPPPPPPHRSNSTACFSNHTPLFA